MNTCSNTACGALTKNRKFCSHRCSAIVTNSTHPRRQRRSGLTCHCGKPAVNTYCSVSCGQEASYRRFIQQWLSGEISGLSPNGITSTRIKRWLIETYGNKCSQCGWAAVHPVTGNIPVELDHIDGDHLNARPENVRLLCPNCHSLTPTFRNLNQGRGRPSRRKTA